MERIRTLTKHKLSDFRKCHLFVLKHFSTCLKVRTLFMCIPFYGLFLFGLCKKHTRDSGELRFCHYKFSITVHVIYLQYCSVSWSRVPHCNLFFIWGYLVKKSAVVKAITEFEFCGAQLSFYFTVSVAPGWSPTTHSCIFITVLEMSLVPLPDIASAQKAQYCSPS